AREEDPHTRFACRPEHLDDLRGDRGAVLQLPEDADLHVVDDENGARRRAGFRERLGNLEVVCPDHSRSCSVPSRRTCRAYTIVAGFDCGQMFAWGDSAAAPSALLLRICAR